MLSRLSETDRLACLIGGQTGKDVTSDIGNSNDALFNAG